MDTSAKRAVNPPIRAPQAGTIRPEEAMAAIDLKKTTTSEIRAPKLPPPVGT